MALVFLSLHPWLLLIIPALLAAGIAADWRQRRQDARHKAARTAERAALIARTPRRDWLGNPTR